MSTKDTPLYKMLKNNPGYMYVTDTMIAVMLPNDLMMIMTGKFQNISEEEANQKVQDAIRKAQAQKN